ncbi:MULTISPECIES: hypothetical protein [Shewanella]|uniref:Uncharacterized protein n=2 Tax=Shewanella psychromarinicola TaxID=2487742 RepID=A0ABN5ST84_9GAMM|nr:hypothetical protein [Shewanella psychromarinicola]AZG37085.1 hypothetical protein EGC80_20920 [Shewanella psychromarinicola]MCL1082990.1 hypothetical protein [Shewanella psychromarinicola]
MTIENMDVFAERPWMGLQRVTEVISLGDHHWASMRSGISKQYTFGTTRTRSGVAAGLEPVSIKNPRWHCCLRGFFVNQPKAD